MNANDLTIGSLIIASGIYLLAALHFWPESFSPRISTRALRRMAVFIILGGVFVIAIGVMSFKTDKFLETVEALGSGDLSNRDRENCVLFAEALPTNAVQRFLRASSNQKDKTLLMFALAWKNRQDCLPFIQSLADDSELGRCAVVSKVALEEEVPFPKRDFASEFFTYTATIAELGKTTNISLEEAAQKAASLYKSGNIQTNIP